jgi:transcriptional regulator with XRE-family HTH domain
MVTPTSKDIKNDLRMFGRNLSAARERIGLDQLEFANLSGYDRTTISKIECGKQAPKFDTLLELAETVQLEPAELLHGVGPKQASPDTPDHDGATPSTPAEVFGANLKWARERAGLSHEKLSGGSTSDRSLLSPWEKGEIEASLRTILKLARALEIPPALLLHGVKLDPQ